MISFDEAAELAYFGAKVLHPATVLPAVQKNIPVFILNSRNPACEGTQDHRARATLQEYFQGHCGQEADYDCERGCAANAAGTWIPAGNF